MEKETEFNKKIDERISKKVPVILKGSGFTDRKLTDTPKDSLQVVSRKFVTLNGAIASRPASSVTTIGQFYLATDLGIPIWKVAGGWINSVGSIIAQNN